VTLPKALFPSEADIEGLASLMIAIIRRVGHAHISVCPKEAHHVEEAD